MTPMKGHTAFLTFAVCPSKNVSATAIGGTMTGEGKGSLKELEGDNSSSSNSSSTLVIGTPSS
jgi:hypothetical protein